MVGYLISHGVVGLAIMNGITIRTENRIKTVVSLEIWDDLIKVAIKPLSLERMVTVLKGYHLNVFHISGSGSLRSMPN